MLRQVCTNVQTCLSLSCSHKQCYEALYCCIEQDTLYKRGWIQRGTGGPDPHEKSQNLGFLSNISHIEQNGEVISSVIHDDHHLLEDNENHSNDEDNHSEENHIHVEINDEDLHDRKYLDIDDDDIVFRHSTSSENIIAA